MSHVDDVRKRVQDYLIDEVGSLQVDKDGDFSLQAGSTRVFIVVSDWGDGDTVVRVFAPTLMDVPASPQLFEFIATRRYLFGSLEYISREDSGNGVVELTHTLLGDYLDVRELMVAVALVAQTADKVDDEMKSQFGGRRWSEES